MIQKDEAIEALKKHFNGYRLTDLTNTKDQYGKNAQDHSDRILSLTIGQDEGYLFYEFEESHPLTSGIWKAHKLNDDQINKLLLEAKTDWIKWNICKKIVDCEHSSYEQRFKVLYKLPKAPIKKKDKFWLRDLMLLKAVNIAKQFSFAHYNNNDENKKICACDLISHLLKTEFDIKISSSQVKAATKGKELKHLNVGQ